MRHEATLRFSLTDSARARAVADALRPESRLAEVPKTRGEVVHEDDVVRVRLHAADLASLRAAVNSYVRWVDAAARAVDVGRG